MYQIPSFNLQYVNAIDVGHWSLGPNSHWVLAVLYLAVACKGQNCQKILVPLALGSTGSTFSFPDVYARSMTFKGSWIME